MLSFCFSLNPGEFDPNYELVLLKWRNSANSLKMLHFVLHKQHTNLTINIFYQHNFRIYDDQKY